MSLQSPDRSAHPREDGEDLLAIGVPRFLAPAAYETPGRAYARIVHDLGRAEVDCRVPDDWLARARGRAEETASRGAKGRSADAEGVARDRSSGIVLVDVESLGFIGRPLFLVGALFVHPDRGGAALQIVQYLARDYSEEEALLRAFFAEAGIEQTWVTFNGSSFDLPFLRLRADLYRMRMPEPADHLDLLRIARRLWGRQLPDCRLRTLERAICGRDRGADLPGARIPDAYHRFVRSGEPWTMIEVLRHNASDLTGLLELYRRARHAVEKR